MSGEIRILHVDDDPEFADLLVTMLERECPDFSIESVRSADAALGALDDGESFDCLVSDYEMPETDGLELLERVRERRPDFPFILFTGKGSEEVASEAISAGVTDYLQKHVGNAQYTLLENRVRNAVEKARAEQEVVRTQRYFSTIFDHSADYVVVIDEHEEVTYVSSSIERVLGYEPDAIVGDPAFDYVHPDDRDRVRSAYDRLFSGDPSGETVEYRVRHADGSWRWIEVSGRNELDDPAIGGVIINCRDVTDQVRHRNRLETLLENLPGYIYRHRNEPGWPLEFVEGDAEAMTGYSADDLESDVRLAETLIHPDDRERVQSAVEKGLRRDGSYDLTYRFVTKDGETRWMWDRGQIIDDPTTGEEKLDGFITDVTETKRREQELERQNERLDEFAAIVSHDLRNPLNVAMGRVELAANECDSEHLEQAATAHERMEALIDDLLTLAREGRTVDELSAVSIADLVDSCWQDVAPPPATLTVEADIVIAADRPRLVQLVENLLRNAVEHGTTSNSMTPDNGDGAQAEPSVTVTVGSLETDGGFYVADDGPGIPPEQRDAVFEPGHTTEADGTGFGLSIVEGIAEAHGWTVTVTDGEHGGARFEFRNVEILDD